jgi:hypothetical protein
MMALAGLVWSRKWEVELIERTAWSGGEVGEARVYESAYGSSLRSSNTAILRMSLTKV